MNERHQELISAVNETIAFLDLLLKTEPDEAVDFLINNGEEVYFKLLRSIHKIEVFMSQELSLPSLRDQVLTWLNQNQYSRASFDRIISHVMSASTYEQLRELVQTNGDIFRFAIIKGGLEGLALIHESSATDTPSIGSSEDEVAAGDYQSLMRHLQGSITGPAMDHDLVHRTLSDDTPSVYPSASAWRDISTEEYREYVFRNDRIIRINNPVQVQVGNCTEGFIGGPTHYITAADGIGHHIPAGWLHLSWKTRAGQEIFKQ
jgi:hypothetical protein